MKTVLVVLFLIPGFVAQPQAWVRISDLAKVSGQLTSSPSAPNILLTNTLRSTDYGSTWDSVDVSPFTNPQFLAWHTTNQQTAFFRAVEGRTPVVLRSDDAGATFTKTQFPAVHRLSIGSDPRYMLGVDVVLESSSMNPTIHRIWRSMDGGTSWVGQTVRFHEYVKSTGSQVMCIPSYREARYFTLDPKEPSYVHQYMESDLCMADCTHYEHLLKSTSFGDSASFQVLPSWNLRELKTGWYLHLFEHNPTMSNEMIVCGTQYMRITLDGGTSWIDTDFRSEPRTAADIDWSSSFLLTGSKKGVSASTSHGQSWMSYNSGLQSLDIRSIHKASDGQWYAVTDEGLYEFVISITSVEGVKDEGFLLEQNHPNPFATTTTIRLSVSPEHIGKHVRITVHDVLGREVATLYDERMTSPVASLSFTPANLSSGVYTLKLNDGSHIINRTMHYLGK